MINKRKQIVLSISPNNCNLFYPLLIIIILIFFIVYKIIWKDYICKYFKCVIIIDNISAIEMDTDGAIMYGKCLKCASSQLNVVYMDDAYFL